MHNRLGNGGGEEMRCDCCNTKPPVYIIDITEWCLGDENSIGNEESLRLCIDCKGLFDQKLDDVKNFVHERKGSK